MESIKAGKIFVAVDDDGTGVFGVRVPDIPNCFSAGINLEEALVNITEAIQSHLELSPEEYPYQVTPLSALSVDVNYSGCDFHEVSLCLPF